MLLFIVIMILIVSSLVLGNIYFYLFYFQNNYQDINNYYNSHYGAIAGIERGLLSSKYMGVGFQGESFSNSGELFTEEFGKFTKDDNYMGTIIRSKAKKIVGKITYDKVTTIILYLNTGDNLYQSDDSLNNFFDDDSYLSGSIVNNFDSITNINDIQLIWLLSSTNGDIIANGISNKISNEKLNQGLEIKFSADTVNIFDENTSNGSGFLNNEIEYNSIGDALLGGDALALHLYLTGSYLKNNEGIIPYLDFEIESNVDFVDLYYYITGSSIVGKYHTNLYINKKTSNYQNPNQKNFIFPYYQ